MTLDYRVRRAGKVWLAWLKRPGNPRPLFVEGRTKHEAIAALLTTVGRMAKSAPERLFGKDWTEGANERAATIAALKAANPDLSRSPTENAVRAAWTKPAPGGSN